MTREEMINKYNQYSAADAYIIGFVLNHMVYYTMMQHLEESYLKLTHMSSKRGGWAKIRVYLSSADRKNLVSTGKVVCLGDESILDTKDQYNKGEHFERIITETLTVEKWVKDNVPFNVAGDIEIDGKQIQIKFDGAELTNERCLSRLQA